MRGKSDYEYSVALIGERKPVLADIAMNEGGEAIHEYARVPRQKGRVLINEAHIPTLGEQGIYVQAKAGALLNANGSVVGAIEIIRDITKSKTDEEELRQHRDRLEELVHVRTREISKINEELSKANGALATEAAERNRVAEELRNANVSLTEKLQELGWINREIEVLNEMSAILFACTRTEDALPVISSYCRKLFEMENGALYVRTQDKTTMKRVVSWGDKELTEVIYPEDCWGIRRGRMHLDIQGSDIPCPHGSVQRPGVSVCVPLIAQTELLGLLHIQSDTNSNDFKMVAQRLVQAVADIIASGLSSLKLQESLRHQSIRDPLTGLFNRRYLEETVERELGRLLRMQGTLSAMVLDIDHFKSVNDRFGHDAGDAVLSKLAEIIRSSCRVSDIACRYGGEEFVLVLPEMGIADASERADQIRQRVGLYDFSTPEASVGRVTVSIGVAAYPNNGKDWKSVFRAADAAVYASKQNGRNRVTVAQPLSA